MLTRFRANFDGLTGLGLTAWQRAQIASELAIADVTPNEPPISGLAYTITDRDGVWQLEGIEDELAALYGLSGDVPDETVRLFALHSGKLVTLVQGQDPGPFYEVNGEGRSILQMREELRPFWDPWNTAHRNEVADKLVELGKSVRPL